MANSLRSEIAITALDETGAAFAEINKNLQNLVKEARKSSAAMEPRQAAAQFSSFGEAVKKAGSAIADNLRDAPKHLLEIGRGARETVSRLGEIVPAVAGITTALSTAGLVALTDRFARAGAGIQRTATTIGISTRDLQRFGGAAEYAGISSETMSSTLKGLDQNVNSAAKGFAGSEGMIWASQRWKIALQNSDGSVRSTTDVLGDLADVMKSLPTTDAQRRFADIWGVGAALPLLRQGRERMRELDDEAQRAGIVISPEDLARAQEFEHTWVGVTQSARGAAIQIASRLAPAMVPLLNDLKHWLENTENIKTLSDGIATVVTAVANAVKSIDLNKVEQLIDKVGDLAKSLGLTSKGGTSGVAGTVAGAGFGAWLGKTFGPYGALIGGVIGGYFGGGGTTGGIRIGRGMAPLFGGPGAGAPGPPGLATPLGFWPGAPAQGRGSAPNDARYNWGSLRARAGGWQEFASAGEGVRAVRDNLMKNYQNLTLAQMVEKWAPGSENDTALLTRRAQQMTGMGAGRVPDLNDPEAMRRIVSAFIANEHGGALPKDLSQADIDRALGHRGAGAGVGLAGVKPILAEAMAAATARLPEGFWAVMTSGARAGGLAGSRHRLGEAMDMQIYGPNGAIANRGEDTTGIYGQLGRTFYEEMAKRQMATRAAWGGNFETSPGSGVRDLMHYDIGGDRGRYGSLAEEYQRLGAGLAVASSAAAGEDSRHEVEVRFANAPPGMRSGLIAGRGPADFSLRTEYAMGTP